MGVEKSKAAAGTTSEKPSTGANTSSDKGKPDNHQTANPPNNIIDSTTSDKISGVTVTDGRGKNAVTYTDQTIDLKPTFDRINKGEKLQNFEHDGSIYSNKDNQLPSKPADYYTEYVVVPPQGFKFPGAQRVVMGQKGEVYYTPDHYNSFIPLHKGKQ
ncbi:ribonuclease domain-containing protein [Neisseriaceae bacterium ESL0693]|nr:ribonuclease domain-containing protein [Neisseriaceae bacterium ESL0693]